MRWKSSVMCALVALVIPGDSPATARDKSPVDPKRESDIQAIGKLTQDLVRAFDKRDAAAVTADWTEDGEFIRNDGEPVRGRAEIQKAHEEFFKALKGKPKLEIQSDGVRFPSADTAIAELTLRLRNDEGETVASSWQNVVLVREGGRWQVAVVREWDRDAGLDVGLKDLEWLVGTWQAVAKDREVVVTYEWDEHRAFIRGKFTVKEGGKVVESGSEVIGKDNAAGAIRSWVFQADGGFGHGVWARDGKKWSVETHGVRADGKKLTATAVYAHVDPNTVTWQATNQSLDGVPVADTPPIKVTKQKSAK